MEDKKMKTRGAMQIILKVSWQEGCKDEKGMWCLAAPEQPHAAGAQPRGHGEKPWGSAGGQWAGPQNTARLCAMEASEGDRERPLLP